MKKGHTETADDVEKLKLLTVEQTAERLNISPRTVYNRARPGSTNPFPIRPRRFGKKVLFLREEVDAFIAAM